MFADISWIAGNTGRRGIACGLLLALWLALAVHPICSAEAGGGAWREVGRRLQFTSNDLYGHIDGGAELFLEFGFADLTVQRYAIGDVEVAVEDYRMTDPVAALGIYLTKCGAEAPVDNLQARNTGNRYQITMVKGDHFIQVNNFSGDQEVRPDLIALARSRLEEIEPTEDPDVWRALPEEGLIAGSELLVRGPFAMQPIFTLGDGDILQLKGRVTAVVGQYAAADSTRYTRIVVPYPAGAAACSAYAHVRANLDPFLEIIATSRNSFTFKDYRDLFGRVELQPGRLEILANLAQLPD